MLVEIVLIVALPTVLVLGATNLLGRTRFASSGEADTDSLSFVGGVFNAVFIVMLAFYIVFAWQSRSDIETHAKAEANALIDIYRQVEVAPRPDARAIRELVRQYATRVVETDWASLDSGASVSAVTATLDELRAAIVALPTDSQVLQTVRQQSLRDVRTIDNHRRARVDELASDDPLTTTLLVGVVAGAALMVVYPMLMGLSRRKNNGGAMALLVVVLGCTVYLSVELADPVRGLFAAEPEAFRAALELFEPS